MDPLDHTKAFVAGWRFPAILITVIGSTVLLMGSVLLIPPSAGSAYAFAEDFKVLCFGYDPATGDMEWAYVWMFLVQPLILGGLVYMVWRGPLRDAWIAHRRSLVRTIAAAASVVALAGFTVPSMVQPLPGTNPGVFPSERIRTEVPASSFTLTNQDSETVSLDAYKGEVVVVTAVYASCGDTCPLILRQIKSAVAELSEGERRDLTVIAITLDPEKDTPSMLSMMADVHGIEAPLYNSVTGDPDYVNQVLDRYGFSRWRNTQGVIEHTNLIHVIDRNGLIAYRLALGEVQEAWLTAAMKELIAEAVPTV